MLVGGKPQQGGAEERPTTEVERMGRFARGEAPGLHPLALGRERRQIDDREPQVRLGLDPLHGQTVGEGEGGPQRRVPARHLTEAPAERRDVEAALQVNDGRDGVERAAGLQLIEKPQPLLGEGERQATPRRRPTEGRDRLSPQAFLTQLGDDGGELGYRRSLEEPAERYLDPEPLANPRHHLGTEQGVPSELEEVVQGADAVDAEHIAPDRRQLGLPLPARRHVGGEEIRPDMPAAGGQAHRPGEALGGQRPGALEDFCQRPDRHRDLSQGTGPEDAAERFDRLLRLHPALQELLHRRSHHRHHRHHRHRRH